MDEFRSLFMSIGGPVGIGLVILGSVFYAFILRWFGALMVGLGLACILFYYIL